MERIKFGTDGWRGIIANQFTVSNVARISQAAALWLLNKHDSPEVIIGYDTRFMGKMFAEVAAKVFAAKGVRVRLCDDYVTAPMVSLAVKEWKAGLGVMITAGHNHYSYNGYKLKGGYGGPLLDEDLKDIEVLISMDSSLDLDLLKWEQYIKQELIRYADLEALYLETIERHFDLDGLRDSGIGLAFDAMYGSGQKIIRKIFPDAMFHRCSEDPTFSGTAPEPLERNMQETMKAIRKNRKIDLGLAFDGDGDRIALISKGGKYIDPNYIILFLIHYLARYKKKKGLVVAGYPSASVIEKLSRHYGLEVVRVPAGFKDICRRMLEEDVLVGGEESGGISAGGYLPERDGIWIGLLILKFLAESGKSLDRIIEEVCRITGPFACGRRDIPVSGEKRLKIIDLYSGGGFDSFGDLRIVRQESGDGFRFFFSKDEWVMIRQSGTEPVIRLYAEAPARERTLQILDIVHRTLNRV